MKAKYINVEVNGCSPGTEVYYVLPNGRKLKLKDLRGRLTATLARATELRDYEQGELEFKTCPTSK